MRITTSKTKKSRRIGRNLFLKGARSFSAKDDFSKRPFKPGVHGNARGFAKNSEYSKQLTEKQALKFVYGLNERQMTNVFKKALNAKGDTGVILMQSLEKRLDNVVYRAGMSNSRAQARQLVSHGSFEVNGTKVDIPSFLVKTGDVITLKPAKAKNTFWTNFKLEVPNEIVAWISHSNQTIKVLNEPLSEDLPKDFNIAYIVEYYSRRVK
jgi:small subunit ribosomal protein S4